MKNSFQIVHFKLFGKRNEVSLPVPSCTAPLLVLNDTSSSWKSCLCSSSSSIIFSQAATKLSLSQVCIFSKISHSIRLPFGMQLRRFSFFSKVNIVSVPRASAQDNVSPENSSNSSLWKNCSSASKEICKILCFSENYRAYKLLVGFLFFYQLLCSPAYFLSSPDLHTDPPNVLFSSHNHQLPGLTPLSMKICFQYPSCTGEAQSK